MLTRSILVSILFLATAACPQLPSTASVAVPPIPAGQARVWFYRDGGPYDGAGTPYIRMNDAIVAISEPGSASYRDVPVRSVPHYGRQLRQRLQPGQECPTRRRTGVVR